METGSQQQTLLTTQEKTDMLKALRCIIFGIGGMSIILGGGSSPTYGAITFGGAALTVAALLWLYETHRLKSIERESEPTIRNLVMQMVKDYPQVKPTAAQYMPFFNQRSANIERLDDPNEQQEQIIELQAFFAGFLYQKLANTDPRVAEDDTLPAKLMLMMQYIYLPNLSAERTAAVLEMNQDQVGSYAYNQGTVAASFTSEIEELTIFFETHFAQEDNPMMDLLLGKSRSENRTD